MAERLHEKKQKTQTQNNNNTYSVVLSLQRINLIHFKRATAVDLRAQQT